MTPDPLLVIVDVPDSPLFHVHVVCGRCSAIVSQRTIDTRTTTAADVDLVGIPDGDAWRTHQCRGH
jgi:hypothetical protein